MSEVNQKEAKHDNPIPEIRDGVALVDFNADWCHPCREQSPIVDKLSRKFRGKAFVLKMNVDHHPGPANSLGITSIPTLIVFKEGSEFQRFVGIQSENTLTNALEQALEQNAADDDN
jgi:thioredoxin 1